LDKVAIVALGEFEDLLQGKIRRRTGLAQDSSMLASLLEEMKFFIEGIHRRGLEDSKKSFNNVFGEFINVPQAIAGPTEKADNLIDILTTNVGDFQLGDPGDKGGGGVFSVRKEMVHHKDEREGSSLLGGFVLIVGLTNLRPEVVRDIGLEVVVGELKVLFDPGVGQPLTIPEIGTSDVRNRDFRELGVEIQSRGNSLGSRIRVNDGEDVMHVEGTVLTFHLADEDLQTVSIVKFLLIIEGQRQQIEFLVSLFGNFLEKRGTVLSGKLHRSLLLVENLFDDHVGNNLLRSVLSIGNS
jgi:hypothetical protein